MAKLYLTSEVKDLIDKKILRDIVKLFCDKDLTEEQVVRFRRELLIFAKYADELIEEMNEIDEEDSKQMERWRAERKAREEQSDENVQGD